MNLAVLPGRLAVAVSCPPPWVGDACRTANNLQNATTGAPLVQSGLRSGPVPNSFPHLDFTWLNDPAGHATDASWFQSLPGGVLGTAVILCGIFFCLGVAGWIAAKNNLAPGGRDGFFFLSRAGIAILAVVMLGSLAAAMDYGNRITTGWSTNF